MMKPPAGQALSAKTLPSRDRIALGVGACLGYLAHATWHMANGTPWDALWVCHVAAFMIGAGMISGCARVNAAGFLCAALGLPSWLLYLVSGQPLIPTSLLTHVAGPLIGILGICSMGLPRGSAALALGTVTILTALSLGITPPEDNVNLAHGPIDGLSLWRLRGPLHYLFLFLQWAAGLFVAQALARWIFGRAGWVDDSQAASFAESDRRMK